MGTAMAPARAMAKMESGRSPLLPVDMPTRSPGRTPRSRRAEETFSTKRAASMIGHMLYREVLVAQRLVQGAERLVPPEFRYAVVKIAQGQVSSATPD